jgi:hypothetical protein
MSVRSMAVRQAAKIRGERAAAFAVREAAIEELAVGFLEASGRAEEAVETARRRCEQIMSAAQASAQRSRAQAAVAVAGLHEMGVPRAEIAQITGLNAREVRDLLTAKPSSAPPDGADAVAADGTAEEEPGVAQDRGPDEARDPDEVRDLDGSQEPDGSGDVDGAVTGGEGEPEGEAKWAGAAGPAAMSPRPGDGSAASP